jgi:hypothetical protein
LSLRSPAINHQPAISSTFSLSLGSRRHHRTTSIHCARQFVQL